MVTVVFISCCFFNCSDLYISSWSCIDSNSSECKRSGHTDYLIQKPVDVVVVLDNSPRAQKMNNQVTQNLNQFLQCIYSVDWRVGVVSNMKDSNHAEPLGHLVNIEWGGEISTHKFINPQMEDYKQIFSETVSLDSGCYYPPYCNKNKPKPLSSIKSFMQIEGHKKKSDTSFLRDYAHLAIIVISTYDETNKGFSSSNMTYSKDALASIYSHYGKDEFIGLVVTDSGEKNNCIHTIEDTLSDGVDFISRLGAVYGVVSMDPIALIGSQLLSDVSSRSSLTNSRAKELIQFAKDAGGSVFDICKPSYGHALAYKMLEKMEMEHKFPSECKKIYKLQ